MKLQLDAYAEGKVDAVYIAYTRFINTMKQEPVIEQLLPLSAARFEQTPRRSAPTRGTTCTSPTRSE